MAEVKCTNCNCHNIFYPEQEEYQDILSNGYGLQIRDAVCIKYGKCYCHNKTGNPVRLLARETEIKAIA